jgi:hypothetical protein
MISSNCWAGDPRMCTDDSAMHEEIISGMYVAQKLPMYMIGT